MVFLCFFLQSMPSERLRNQLTLMSTALHKAITKIQPEAIKVHEAFLIVIYCYLQLNSLHLSDPIQCQHIHVVFSASSNRHNLQGIIILILFTSLLDQLVVQQGEFTLTDTLLRESVTKNSTTCMYLQRCMSKVSVVTCCI